VGGWRGGVSYLGVLDTGKCARSVTPGGIPG
jgi:hypothetical protein